MHLRRSLRPFAIALALAASLPACRSSDALRPVTTPTLARRILGDRLVQTVRLSTARVATGDTIGITATIENRGEKVIHVTTVVCNLDTDGTIELMPPLILCFAYSASLDLAPGESVTGHYAARVASPSGHYRLQVRQLLEPQSLWVNLPIEVTRR